MSPEFFDFVVKELIAHGDVGLASEVNLQIVGDKHTYPVFINNLKLDRSIFFFPMSAKKLTFHPHWFGTSGWAYEPAFVSVIVTAWPKDEYVVAQEISLEELFTKFNNNKTFKL